MTKGIQVIGTQRSGSNLLRVMLHQSSHICAPHPPHLLRTFYPILEMYEDLSQDHNFKCLVSDVIHVIHLNPVNWNYTFSVQEVIEHCKNQSLPQVMKAVYELMALKKNAGIWCNKSMANVKYFKQMEDADVHPFYIYLYRDGRDVALSFKKAVVGEKHIYHLAKQWRQDQILAMNLGKEIGEDRIMNISYESFTQHPKTMLVELCHKLDIPFESEMLDYYKSDESRYTAQAGNMWNNLVKPVLKHNSNKFLSELSADDILIFESIAGDVLETLGYPLVNPNSALRKEFSATEIDTFTSENKKMKEAIWASVSLDMEKRQAQEEFIHELYQQFYTYEAINKQ
ncbi:MAG: sulfotransferase [Bacteroidetes bacterium]|nr:sulfotransferase [Bacteroidota bacterium]